MIRRAALLAVLLLAAAPHAGARAALSCPTPTPPAVAVSVEAGAPAIDNTLTQPALQQVAGTMPHGDLALGYYRANLEVRWRTFTAWRSAGTEACHWIERVAIEIALVDRKIYIIRERRPGSCPYDSVLGHERKHQAVDDAVVAEYRPLLVRAAERAVAGLPPPTPDSIDRGDAVEARLTGTVETALQSIVKAMLAVRAARQAAVDTPAEYRRNGAACG
jgi:hypothetical protein